MSLVHDALEKAKREASAQKARELGLPETHAASQPFRARKRAATIPIAIASLGTLAVVVAVYLLARDDRKETARAAAAAAAPATAAPESLAPVSSGAPGAATPPLASGAEPSAVPAAAEPAASAAGTGTDRQLETTSSDPPAPTPAAVDSIPPSSPAPPTPTAGRPNVRGATAAPPAEDSADARIPTFVRELKLDDGTAIRLGGIAWSAEAPLAYLNGKLRAKRESVDGFRVERIEKERVLLVRGNARYFVKL